MRDPYDILGIRRGANFEEVRAAYRKGCKTKHPNAGGGHEEFIEFRAAYEQILEELKQGYRRHQEAPRREQGYQRQDWDDVKEQHRWEQTARDIDEELENLRRAAEDATRAHEDAFRSRREQAWASGKHGTWAKLTWQDLVRFFTGIARSGLKGLSLLFAALLGVGTVLLQANVVSAIVLLGSGIGFMLSLALKSDKGGLMSAGLLLFGLMTIWLPPVRAALFLYPLATISVLLCLALILKFAQQGGTVGLLTGGVLSLYVLGVIVADTQQKPQTAPARVPSPDVAVRPPSTPPANSTAPNPGPPIALQQDATRNPPLAAQPATPFTPQRATVSSRPATTWSPDPPVQVNAPPPPPEPRVLLASEGAVLKFVAGVPYRLKVRSGRTTSLHATQGQVAFYAGDVKIQDCADWLIVPSNAAATPYQELDRTLRACGTDAIMQVSSIR